MFRILREIGRSTRLLPETALHGTTGLQRVGLMGYKIVRGPEKPMTIFGPLGFFGTFFVLDGFFRDSWGSEVIWPEKTHWPKTT